MQGEETAHRVVGGRYRLVEQLGRGGMGTVWRAVDALLKREVAVKHVALPAGLEGRERADVRERVMREAQTAARLSHQASVTVFDVLEDDGSVYIVMELVDAANLAERVDSRGPLDAAQAAKLGLELVGALEAAHRQGIVHRDVKPSNVMLLSTGAVKLADFGIASVKDHPSLTSTGQVLGSPSYMAPEQALGQRSGPEADWWGLGATLYYAVEGRPPFERPGALPTLTAVVNDLPSPPANAGPLAPVLDRLLAKEPADRPGASELRRLLRPVAANGSASSPRAEPAAAGGPDGRDRAGDDTASMTAVIEAPSPSRPAPVVQGPPAPPPAPVVGEPAPTVAPPPAPTRADPRWRAVPAPAPVEPRRIEPARRPAPAPVAPSRQRSLGPLVVAALALVALLAAAAAISASRRDDPSPTRAGPSETRSSTTGAPEAARAPSTGAPSTRGTLAAPAGDVPGDWVAYTDPEVGYRVSHPPGWQVRQLDGTRTDITDPATGSYLRVDWTATPGPSAEGAWEAQSKSFGARHEAYQEITIEPTDYRGFDAAIWEYAYTARGARLHAVNLGMVTGTHGFALNFQTSEQRWISSQPLFESFKASFRPPA